MKYKARICVDGSQQRDGVDFFSDEIYSSVCQWSSVRLILILASLLGFKMRQIDYLQAFPQADIDSDVYLKIPTGWKYDVATKKIEQVDPKFRDNTHYIKLKKNVYGTKQASANFY